MDTIFALATSRGKAGVSVVRISGPRAFDVARAFGGTLPQPRRASLRHLKDPKGVHLDDALVICFDEGHSFTGEETVELHLHGSTAIVAAVLRHLTEFPDMRQAEPGEFTRRALENERLDLAQVEGLADLIDAETEMQRRQALRVLSGALGQKAEAWRTKLIRAAALLEATIDFADEDVPVDVSPEVDELLGSVQTSLEAEVRGAAISERIRDGFEVAIVGPPNIGKSTLLNALAGREAAITSEYAGTTRDVIEVRMDLDGIPVTFLDTAGLRETNDVVEGIGIERAVERAKAADIRVFLRDGNSPIPDLVPLDGDVVALGKADQITTEDFAVSGKTGLGINRLIEKISAKLSELASGSGVAIRERHRICMMSALTSLESARNEVSLGLERTEIAAQELRNAIRSIEILIGRVDVENLLDEIFSSFCIGK